jgi:hypothetical protein
MYLRDLDTATDVAGVPVHADWLGRNPCTPSCADSLHRMLETAAA